MFKNHPKGLLAAALANMGERFGFYTMMAILVLFLQAKFGLSGTNAGIIYSIFYFSIYILAFVGGLIADKTRNPVINLVTGFLNCSRKASPNPLRVTIPKRAAISCKTMVAMTENNNPHKSAYPNFAPAMEQLVTVPGPINAAVTKAAGPMDFSLFVIVLIFIFHSS